MGFKKPLTFSFRNHLRLTQRPHSTKPIPTTSNTINTMSEPTQKFIVVFKDGVTAAQIDEYVKQLDSTGGKVNNPYYKEGGILNGFAADITPSFLDSFQTSAADVISYIEPDGIVTTQ
ncbi:hypothetical protein BJ165DRAFT_1501117 [Panaeolus papilionaceus]|nr:hypothetical protein BJ165DRAFT_1501117 [Panaeolus papilionaceus]